MGNQDIRGKLEDLFSGLQIAPDIPVWDSDAHVTSMPNGTERYRTLVENLPVGIYRITPGPNARLLIANQAFFDIFGVDRQEMLGQDCEASSDPNLTPGQVAESEVQVKRKDGTPMWCSIISRTVLKSNGEVAYYDCVVTDLTGSKQAEQSIWASDFWERRALDAMPEAVLVITLERNIVSANAAAERIFGYTLAEWSCLSLESLYAEQYPEMDQAIGALMDKGEQVHLTIDARKKSGEIFVAEHTLRVIRNNGGQPVAILSIVRDLGVRRTGLTGRLTTRTLSTSDPCQTCAYLGLFDDSKTHHKFPSESNYCHARLPPIAIEPHYQTSTCLSGNWSGCHSYKSGSKPKG